MKMIGGLRSLGDSESTLCHAVTDTDNSKHANTN